MRKLILLAAAVVVSGWLASGTSAKADLGCVCTSFGKMTCVSGISACWPNSGICTLPCDYTPLKTKKAKKMSKKKM